MADLTAHCDRIEQVVTRRALRDPHAIALQAPRRQVSYGQLVAAAAAVTRELAADGVRPGDCVPILAARSPELAYGALGVLGAGAAYAAIDPAWPPDRIRIVLGQLAARRVLVDRPYRLGLMGIRVPRPLVLPATVPLSASDWPWPARVPAPPGVSGADAAFVHFTFAGGGTARGVISPHADTMRAAVDWPTLPLDASTASLQASSPSSDLLALELWGPLLNGGSCVLLPAPNLDGDAIISALRTGEVNTLWLPAALFAALAGRAARELSRARLVVVTGGRVPLPAARAVLAAGTGVRLVHGYRPGAAGILPAAHGVTAADLEPRQWELPLGRATPGIAVQVVDAELEPVPPGITGEIVISGDGHALGGAGNPGVWGGSRKASYRTGDLGLADDTGLLWYRGRAGGQLQPDGSRIEPGEIEAIVEMHPAVCHCALTAAGLSLVAFYVSDRPVPEQDLRDLVRRHLAGQGMPAAFVRAAALPLTPDGEVDHAALGRAVAGRAAAGRALPPAAAQGL